jgi:methylenetetrahydrofolate dehydrogenase (NADP+)/methenyltetrahydrofolate cyclohydrolase
MITCKEYVTARKEELKKEIATFKRKPKLCVVQVGNDPASAAYVRNKQKTCEELGIEFDHIHIADYEGMNDYSLANVIVEKNGDETVDGIIVQLPLPEKFNAEFVTKFIISTKDVDGFGVSSPFKPCTPKGIMDYLKYNEVAFEGKECVVIGRSKIVGKPLVNMLIDEGATVTCCNSKTWDIRKHIYNADMVFSAIGKANFFDETFFNGRQVLVDVGINRDENGKLCGDITKESKEMAELATPVPGGVGLLTVCSLMENVVAAHKGEEQE